LTIHLRLLEICDDKILYLMLNIILIGNSKKLTLVKKNVKNVSFL